MSEYVLGLIRYDLLIQRDHATTASLSELNRSEQDKVDDEVARAFLNGETLGGSYFEARLEAAVKAAGMKKKPGSEKVADELLKRIRKKPPAA